MSACRATARGRLLKIVEAATGESVGSSATGSVPHRMSGLAALNKWGASGSSPGENFDKSPAQAGFLVSVQFPSI